MQFAAAGQSAPPAYRGRETPGRRFASAAFAFLLLLLLARLILGLTYSGLNPLGEAPDEADHYAYVAYIGREGRLPEGTTITQGKHPPLYYLLAAAVARPAGLDFAFLRANPDVGVTADALAPNFFVHTGQEAWPWHGGPLAMHLARGVSVLAGLLLVLATYGLGRGLWPAQPEIALAAAAFVAFLPESLFVGGSVSNDMLAAALSALALWCAVGGRGWPAALGTGIALGLGFLTKASVIAVWPVAALVLLLLDGWRVRQPFHRAGRFLLAAIVATAIAAPWLWRNWTLYGDPLGTPVVLGTIDHRQTPLDLVWLARGWFLGFWGKFGGAGHIPLPWPLVMLWGVIVAGAVAGGVKVAGNRLQVARESGYPSTGDESSTPLSGSPAQDASVIGLPSSVRRRPSTGVSPSTELGRSPAQDASVIGLPSSVRRRPSTGDESSTPLSGSPAQDASVIGRPSSVRRRPSTGDESSTPLSGSPAQDASVIGRPLSVRWLVLAGAPLLVMLSMISYSQIALGTDQGRLLFPALAPFGLLIAAGWAALLPGARRLLAPVFAAVMLAAALLALITGIVQPFAPQLATTAEVAAASPIGQPVGGLELVAAAWHMDGTAQGLTLYWRAAEPVDDDLRVILRLYGDGDARLWEWKRSPGAGRYSTDRWRAGEVVPDPYRVPVALDAVRRAEVTLYAFPDETPLGRVDVPVAPER